MQGKLREDPTDREEVDVYSTPCQAYGATFREIKEYVEGKKLGWITVMFWSFILYAAASVVLAAITFALFWGAGWVIAGFLTD
jgi:hypothetical protein